jgi:hypothetical protein
LSTPKEDVKAEMFNRSAVIQNEEALRSATPIDTSKTAAVHAELKYVPLEPWLVYLSASRGEPMHA